MNLCDVNVWLALTLSRHVHHQAVLTWLEGVDEPASIYFCRFTQSSFLRLLTNSAVLAPYGNPPLTNQEAWEAYQALLVDDRIVFEETEPADLEPLWHHFAVGNGSSPKLWMDAYLAAFAMAGGLTIVTTDGAFEQFEGPDLVVLSGRW